ncbi:hypothetical protein [Fervidobacterium sp.]
MKKNISVPILLALLLLFSTKAFSDYVIIVIDTSLSMNRKVIDSQRLYDIALKSLSNAIYSLKKGDIVYLADFNEKTYIRGPIEIKGEHTKDVIVKLMYGTQPYGKWTFTYQMLKDISMLIKTNNIPPEKSRIIIISDGIDDPPIKTKEYFVELEKISSMFNPSQLIYYVSLENLIKQPKPEEQKSIIKEKIKDSKISVIEVKKPEEAQKIITETIVGTDIINKALSLGIILLLAALLLVILLNLATIISSRKKSKISKVICKSEKTKKSFKLPPIKKTIIISREKGDIKLKDWNYDGEVKIKSTLSGYRIFVTDTSKVISPFKNGEILSKGYKLIISNYTLEFE